MKSATRRLLILPVLLSALPTGTPVYAGIVFREAESIEQTADETGSQQIRQVLAEGDNCKVLVEETTDPAVPAGAYILASSSDAFLVDPVDKTIAPMDPTTMLAVSAPEPAAVADIADVSLRLLFDGPGPEILGLPTRHLVFRLRYRETGAPDEAGVAQVVRWSERHEVWVTPWLEGELTPAAWQKFRVIEDAGSGSDRQDLQNAIEQIQGQGMVMRHTIERRSGPGNGSGELVSVARVVRDVTSFSRKDLQPDEFLKPEDYRLAEFLAPQAGTPRGGGRDPGGADPDKPAAAGN